MAATTVMSNALFPDPNIFSHRRCISVTSRPFHQNIPSSSHHSKVLPIRLKVIFILEKPFICHSKHHALSTHTQFCRHYYNDGYRADNNSRTAQPKTAQPIAPTSFPIRCCQTDSRRTNSPELRTPDSSTACPPLPYSERSFSSTFVSIYDERTKTTNL